MFLEINDHVFTDSDDDVSNEPIFKYNCDFEDVPTKFLKKGPFKQKTPPRFIKKITKVPACAQPSHAKNKHGSQFGNKKDNAFKNV